MSARNLPNTLKNLALALMFLAFSAPGLAAAQAPGPYVALKIIPEKNTVVAGQTLRVAVEQTITPNWHTYYLNPGDSGAEPRITWTLPEGMQAGMLRWPAPERIPYAGLMNYGYAGSVTLVQELKAPQTLPDGPLTLTAEIEVLVCNDICIPETSTHTLVLNDATQEPVDNTATINAIIEAMPRDSGITATYHENGKDLVVTITHESEDGFAELDPSSVAFFPGEWGLILNAQETRVTTPDAKTIIINHQRDERDLADTPNFSTLLTYKNKDGSKHSYITSTTPSATPPVVTDAPVVVESAITPETIGFAQALLFALLGGLVLNLMPCVFPVLSLKALKLIDLQSKGHGTAALHGVTYTAGILLSFAAIAGAMLAIKAVGGDAGWGFQLQNPFVILSLAYLLFIIGLSLSGLFEISGSFVGTGAGLTRKGGLTGTFFTGVLATLVATPCTAPFMAGALGYALLQPAPIALGIFLMLGFGLALPYLLLSVVPGLAKLLPKPGAWMVTFREMLAFPMYAAAAWMVWILSMQSSTESVMWALSGMVAIAFAIWAIKHRPKHGAMKIIVAIIVLLALLFAATPFLNKTLLQEPSAATQASTANTMSDEAYTPTRLNELLATDRPVFVYMTAAWCITCKVNEKVALHNAATIELFQSKNVAVLKGDWTRMNPDITKYLKDYGRNGVPLYVYYAPAELGGKRPAPVVLPQILTPGIVADAVGTP